MKNCDGHGAVFNSEKALDPNEGYLISADYIKSSTIYDRFLEQASGVIGSLGISMAEYKAQMDSIQGDGPWMLCEQCVKVLNLSASDLAMAKEAGQLWQSDKSTPGITPGKNKAAGKPQAKKSSSGKGAAKEPQYKIFVDALILFIVLLMEIGMTALYLFTQDLAFIGIIGMFVGGAVIFSTFILVRRHWLIGSLYILIPEFLLFVISLIAWLINDISFELVFLFMPIVAVLARLGMVAIGKKILQSQEKPLSYLKEFLLSIVIYFGSYVLFYSITNALHFYFFVSDISEFVSWALILFVFSSLTAKKSQPVSSYSEQVLFSPQQPKPYSSMTEEELFSGSDEEALKKVFGRLTGE